MKSSIAIFKTIVVLLIVSFVLIAMSTKLLQAENGRLEQIAEQSALSSVKVKEAIEEFRKLGAQKTVTVGIIATGVDTSVPELKGRLLGGASFVESEPDVFDYHGFGTHVTAIVAAVAPNAKILPIKALDKRGNSSLPVIIKGINFAIDQKVQILLIAGGGPKATAELGEAAVRARKNGVLFIAPSGNAGSEKPIYPGFFKNVLAVGSTDGEGKLASFTSYGDWVSLYAPGLNVKSIFGNDRFITLSGAQASAATVAGIAALIMGINPNLRIDSVEKILITTATDISAENRKLDSGARRLNALAAVRAAKDSQD
ncbi:MAG: S8 family serine peptidase [bacterium]